MYPQKPHGYNQAFSYKDKETMASHILLGFTLFLKLCQWVNYWLDSTKNSKFAANFGQMYPKNHMEIFFCNFFRFNLSIGKMQWNNKLYPYVWKYKQIHFVGVISMP